MTGLIKGDFKMSNIIDELYDLNKKLGRWDTGKTIIKYWGHMSIHELVSNTTTNIWDLGQDIGKLSSIQANAPTQENKDLAIEELKLLIKLLSDLCDLLVD